jgi:hypothetical protein
MPVLARQKNLCGFLTKSLTGKGGKRNNLKNSGNIGENRYRLKIISLNMLKNDIHH